MALAMVTRIVVKLSAYLYTSLFRVVGCLRNISGASQRGWSTTRSRNACANNRNDEPKSATLAIACGVCGSSDASKTWCVLDLYLILYLYSLSSSFILYLYPLSFILYPLSFILYPLSFWKKRNIHTVRAL